MELRDEYDESNFSGIRPGPGLAAAEECVSPSGLTGAIVWPDAIRRDYGRMKGSKIRGERARGEAFQED